MVPFRFIQMVALTILGLIDPWTVVQSEWRMLYYSMGLSFCSIGLFGFYFPLAVAANSCLSRSVGGQFVFT